MREGTIYDPTLYASPLNVFLPSFFPHICSETLPNGDIITMPSPKMHFEVIEALKKSKERTLIVAPRGSAKSTLITFLWVLYVSLYGLSTYTVIVSDSHTKACDFLSRIRMELEKNDFLREVFDITLNKPWAEGQISFTVGWLPKNRQVVNIIARGAGQSLRGFVKDVRPELIVLDDVETDESTATKQKVEKMQKWFWGQIVPSLDPINGKVIVVGTIISEESLLSSLISLAKQLPDTWVYKHYAIMDENKHSIWPERFPDWKIAQIKDEYERTGMLDKFYKEYMNDPQSNPNKPLDWRLLRPYNRLLLAQQGVPMRYYVAVDFGATPGLEGVLNDRDYTVVMVGGVDYNGNIYIVEYIKDRISLPEAINFMFALYFKYNCRGIAIESGGPQKAFYNMVIEAQRTRMQYMNTYELKHSTTMKKSTRIMTTIQPKLSAGKIYYLPENVEVLEDFKYYDPKSSRGHDDLLDCLSNLLIYLGEVGVLAPRMEPANIFEAGIQSDLNKPRIFMP